MSDQHSREISIFLEAIEKSATDELQSYLNEACGDDQQLRADVEALLVAHRKDNDFLERPVPQLRPHSRRKSRRHGCRTGLRLRG